MAHCHLRRAGDQKNYGNFLEDPDLESNEFIGFNSAGDLVATVGKGTYTGSVKLYDGGTGVFKKTLLNATLSGYEVSGLLGECRLISGPFLR